MGFSAMTSRCRGSAGAALVLAAGLAAPLAAVEPDMADPGPYMVPSTMEQTLGPRDLTVIPAGVERRLLNSDAGTVRFASIVGDPATFPVHWHAAQAT